MSPTATMVPFQVHDHSGHHASHPKPTQGKSRKNPRTPPARLGPAGKQQQLRFSPGPAGRRRVSFSVPALKESLSDSELMRVQEVSYAGAKFSEAPSPNNLPMPPATWLGGTGPTETKPTANNRVPLEISTPPVRKDHGPSSKPSMFVPCQRMTDELKFLLKVES